ncbi:MAG: acyl-CoA thioesterase [Acidobacteriaceae bacterium]|nr:acyl-CoA thioesterase [Acidobacteriaceae bacterium]
MEKADGTRPKHEIRLRVRYAETDQMGVVYYANYLVWLEIGRVEFVRSRGFNYKDVEEQEGLFLAVTESNCRYLYPARYDQEIVIQTEVSNSGPRFIEFTYEIRSTDPDRLLAHATTRHVWVNREWRPTRLPEKYRNALFNAG